MSALVVACWWAAATAVCVFVVALTAVLLGADAVARDWVWMPLRIVTIWWWWGVGVSTWHRWRSAVAELRADLRSWTEDRL